MARDLYESLPQGTGWLARLARAVRDADADFPGSLAEGELLDLVDDDEPMPARLAAAETLEVPFPVEYTGSGLRLLLGRDADGPYAVAVGAAMRWGDLALAVGVPVRVAVDAPPAWIVVRVGDRDVVLLP